MGINNVFWQGKRVLLTGHTGFKGSWLSLWLQQLGAHVIGFSLAPVSQPNLFEIANVAEGINSIFGDIRDINVVKQVFLETQPDIVIHMAAQALVRYSYNNPVETYQTNVMGTL
ncbi:MAG: NAD-dependent epimerase/dehydratase family protein, partial [Methylomarinum sp.]|nr:NAD-dependent epimerase/dehydratase family protein [Methylomarinum sp.]